MKKVLGCVLAFFVAGTVFAVDDDEPDFEEDRARFSLDMGYDAFSLATASYGSSSSTSSMSMGLAAFPSVRLADDLHLIAGARVLLTTVNQTIDAITSIDAGFALKKLIFISGTMSLYSTETYESGTVKYSASSDFSDRMFVNLKLGVRSTIDTGQLMKSYFTAGVSFDYFKIDDTTISKAGLFIYMGI